LQINLTIRSVQVQSIKPPPVRKSGDDIRMFGVLSLYSVGLSVANFDSDLGFGRRRRC